MRHALLLVALGTALFGGACGTRARPYRFASPMLATADVPLLPLRAPPAPPRARPELANREAHAIRVVSAPQIREASAAMAEAVTAAPAAQPEARAALPAPHRLPAGAVVPALHVPADLRALVGYRDKRDPFAVASEWSRALGRTTDGATSTDLLAWAESSSRLADPTAIALPGDLLIFDHAPSDLEADLIAVVIDRDARGVTEYVYLGGGVVRRGFVDVARPVTRRDRQGLVVNTYLRHGKRWPAKGTHYLAGELIAHVVHTR